MKLSDKIVIEELPVDILELLTETVESKVDSEFATLESIEEHMSFIDRGVDEPTYEVLVLSLESIIKIANIELEQEDLAVESIGEKVAVFAKKVYNAFLMIVNRITTFIKKWLAKLGVLLSKSDDKVKELLDYINNAYNDSNITFTLSEDDIKVIDKKYTCALIGNNIFDKDIRDAAKIFYLALSFVKKYDITKDLTNITPNDQELKEAFDKLESGEFKVDLSYPTPDGVYALLYNVDNTGNVNKYIKVYNTTFKYLSYGTLAEDRGFKQSGTISQVGFDVKSMTTLLQQSKSDRQSLINTYYDDYKKSIKEFKDNIKKYVDSKDILAARRFYLAKMRLKSKSMFAIVTYRNRMIAAAKFIKSKEVKKDSQ